MSTTADLTQQTPTAAPAPVAGAPPAWQLQALLRPAVVPTREGVLSSAARLWLDWAVQATSAALDRTLDRPAQLQIVAASAPTPPAKFGIIFSHPACAGEGLIAFDAAAGRILVDALESDFANLRGPAALSDVEAGLLEYAALACSDQVLRDALATARDFVIRHFAGPREAQAWVESNKFAAVPLHLRLAGREGAIALYLPGWTAADAAAAQSAPPPAPPASLDATLELRLALPPLLLSKDDRARLAPGDVLLLGASDLKSFAANCRLVTSTGWSLSAATVIQDGAASVAVTAAALQIRVHEAIAVKPPEPLIAAVPVIGSATLTLDQIRRWNAGSPVTLAKNPAAPAAIYHRLDLIGAGELVRADQEIGLRLLEVAPPAGGA